ncbi:glycoside hydrolase N-terminal domain-containing protein [Pelagicoccus sp. SDUM812005]|nr:glycoside hydrolase N-terminal domain-containing protein [Pelagicoccus sp. SDUM812005]
MVTPAAQWREGLPSGNGEVGALVYGSIAKERILFNHNKLWYGGKTADIPDMSEELAVVRRYMLEGDYLKANSHYRETLREKGFEARNAVYHPAFDLLLSMDSERMFADYERRLDFETGEVAVVWRDGDTRYLRRLFVSAADDVAVYSIAADRSGAVSGEIALDIHDLEDAILQNGESFDPGFRFKTAAEGSFLEFRATGSDGGEFGGVARVLVRGGEVKAENRPLRGAELSYANLEKQGGRIRFEDADSVLVVLGFFANEDAEGAIPRLKRSLLEKGESYERLLSAHVRIHREKFNSVRVDLNRSGKMDTPNEYLLLDAYRGEASAELMQKLFDYGRYLLVSSSRDGGNPANLQGIWNGDYRPPWSSLYGINENLQMSYWQALPGDLKDSMMAFFDFFDAHLDEFRYNARQLYGCDGIYIPPFMSPDSGIMRHTAPHVIYWTDAAGWLASFYYDYYLFTGDEAFLRDRAVPFMKEVAAFYEDFIVKDERGVNLFFPSQSPENQPADKVLRDPRTGRETKIKVQINSTIAVAISKEVLGNLIAACQHLGIEEQAVPRWKTLLASMPAYDVNEDGALKEWLHPDFKDNYEHRHQSHIYPLFPGQELSREATPELYEASKVAIEKRLRIGLKSQTGWSLAHMANVYARLSDGEKAFEALDILARSCLGQNLFTYHNDWRDMGVTLPVTWGRTAPFQMDANFGIPAAILEMLCGGSAKMLRLLPALPEAWPEGEFRDVLTRAGIRTSARWDWERRSVEVRLVAERDSAFTLSFPAAVDELVSEASDRFEKSSYGEAYRELRMGKGEELSFKVILSR